jgi:S1-C subfamily serine protease
LLFACLAAALLFTVPAHAAEPLADLQAVESGFIELAARVRDGVVAIETQPANSGRASRAPMVGSGFVVSPGGLIVTNDHVIREAEAITVVLSGGRRCQASVVGRDPRSDLAVISVPQHGLKPVEMSDLADVRVGQWALAMGNPFGMARDGNPSLTYGIVSCLGKSLPELEVGDAYYGNLIQTTAAINPGNSGGPLFNIHGQVIGVNTAIEVAPVQGEGMGFAVPICARTRSIIDSLMRGEEVQYGCLGVQIRDGNDQYLLSAYDGDDRGVAVTRVFPDSAAALAQIVAGDLLVEFRGTRLTGMDQLIRLVGATPVGEEVRVQLFRGQRLITKTVRIQNRKDVMLASGE